MFGTVGALVGVLAGAVLAAQNSEIYTYKPGEYAAIENGRAPNGQYSIAAHGEGEDGLDHFFLYLMAEPGHKKIGPLEEVEGSVYSAPRTYTARWSPDSRHVAIEYTAMRHIQDLKLYRLQGRRATLVQGPLPVETVLKGKPSSKKDENESDLRSTYFQVRWLRSTRFVLHEGGQYTSVTPGLIRAMGTFGKTSTETLDGQKRTYLDYSIDETCELAPGNKWRVVNLKPGRFAAD